MTPHWTLPYTGNLSWLDANTLFVTRHGSHAYGTNIATSDEDYKGFCLPPREYLLGFIQHFEQAEVKVPDMVIYDLRKFFNLAADCNPNIIEMLWVEPSDMVRCTPLAEKVLSQRAVFLSKKARHTFSGYALSQLKRIKGHYKWLKDPPQAAPTRAEYGLPERTVIPADQLAAAMAAVQKKLDTWEWKHLEDVDPGTRTAVQNSMAEILAELSAHSDHRAGKKADGDSNPRTPQAEEENTRFRAAARTLAYDENFIELLDRERHYNARQKDWEAYQLWKRQRNPARAELEAKFGYDTKHAMHLVRLLRMCREILTTGRVVVKRPDREELLAIRAGAWRYEDLLAYAESEDQALNELYKTSPLPRAPDRNALDLLCIEVVEAFLRGER